MSKFFAIVQVGEPVEDARGACAKVHGEPPKAFLTPRLSAASIPGAGDLMQANHKTDLAINETTSLSEVERQHAVDVEVGKRIKKRRQQLRVSQTALGAAVGVSFQQIQKYERGTNRVSSSVLYSLANMLDVPIAYFFETLSRPRPADCSALDQKAALREEFVATDEGQRLVDAFMTVPKKMRPKFISLLSTFCETL